MNMETYRKDLFRAAVVNQNYRSKHAYAKANGLSPVTVGKVWNGDTDITIDKLMEICKPLNLTLPALFTPEEVPAEEAELALQS